MDKKGFCIWFTGLPSSGKTTIAYALAPKLEQLGFAVQVLDGDEVRLRLSKGLGFSRADRDENISRIAFVANSIVKSGGVAITCAISPFRVTRDAARAEIGHFVEVHVATPLDECVRRDVKGLYKKAIAGEIPSFTGISDPYEPPLHAEITVPTQTQTLEESVNLVLGTLREMGYVEGGRVRPHGGVLVDRVASSERRATLLNDARSLPTLELDADTASDVENIATGLFSPLTGFLGAADFESVITKKSLESGVRWTIPIVLDVTADQAARLGARFVLTHGERALAVMTVDSKYHGDKRGFCQGVFGTTDGAHPGVARVMRMGPVFLGGPIELVGEVDGPLRQRRLTPARARALFDQRGFSTIAAFQTRNVPHLGHEHLQRIALNVCDGLLVNPVIGGKKPGDFRDEVILAAYETLTDRFYPRDRVVLATLHTWMRYAGPMEAIHHAILRQNLGCSHIIIGRDHAGVGSYYDPFAAHRAFDELPGLEIQPIRIAEAFYCNECATMATSRDCPHGDASRVSVSASQVRAALADAGVTLPNRMRNEILDVIRRFDAPFVAAPQPTSRPLVS
ncbi:MAG: sulfate adenylyltransferase [Planctomycetes bacterium]|nr:sulfate adenylyltransferase [Planctomycetota bacterium]MBI3844391.1 sulfate adenylyltransferase [Planctomycetota bacterium]